MEFSYENADALIRTIGGISAKHLGAFINWLIDNQYSVSYVCQLARQALAFGRWCEARGISLHALSEDDIVWYQRSRRQRLARRLETRRRERHALELLLHALRNEGICPAAPAHATPAEDVTVSFAWHLQHDQGLADITVERYTRTAHQFLVWRFGHGNVCLRDLRATDTIAFVQSEAKRLGPSSLKNVVTALRSFLRYGQFRGEVPAGLAAAVPAVAAWATTPPIPKAISAEHAQRALDSCDCQTSVGLRDRAVLLLLARLGLRAVEIVRLMLDDINWEHAQLRVRGKGGRESLLPLTAEVGEAIAAYLEHGRPTSQDRHLFLRSIAPIRGLMEGSDAIGSIVRYALSRAKVDAPHRGSHQFRHALAVHMLQAGASLPEIGQVLRHRSPQSTSLYAKVDLTALRALAVTWPGGCAMNTLREALQEYLDLRRGLGFKMHDAGLLLFRFVSFMEQRQAVHITTRLALEWAQCPSVQPAEWARRLCFVRGFARYRSATDNRTEVPPVGLLPHRSTRARPYLYTEEEVQRLLDAALELPVAWPSTPLRPWVFYCLIGLLSVTGLRISEALNLELGDVNIDDAVLTIRGTKHGRLRLVPIHASTCTVLADYLRRREAFFDHPISSYVFVTRCGTRLDIGRVHRTFYALSRRTGLRAAGASNGPRLHDFRHRFAVQTLNRWYQSGEDAWRLLPVLSAYLGHIYVAGTYWYLSDHPELMAQAMDRLERRWGEPS